MHRSVGMTCRKYGLVMTSIVWHAVWSLRMSQSFIQMRYFRTKQHHRPAEFGIVCTKMVLDHQSTSMGVDWESSASEYDRTSGPRNGLDHVRNNNYSRLKSKKFKKTNGVVNKSNGFNGNDNRNKDGAYSTDYKAFIHRKTEELLRITEEGYDPTDEVVTTVKVNVSTFRWLINAWRTHPGGAMWAEALLQRMEVLNEYRPELSVVPDVRVFTKVINAIARSGEADAATRAVALLDRMEVLSSMKEEYAPARPNAMTYTATIEACHQGRDAQKADAVYGRMREAGWRPTPRALHAVLLAWCKEGEAHRALKVLKEAPEGTASTSSYNAVLDALAKKGERAEAEKLLTIMEEKWRTMSPEKSCNVAADDDDDDDVMDEAECETEEGEINDFVYARPNLRTYNSLLNAHAKSGEPDAAYRAEEFLERMEQMYEVQRANGDTGAVKPDVTSFSTVINAWARSHHFGKAEHALKLLNYMMALYTEGKNEDAKPNVIIFNSVLNACAFTVGNEFEQGRALDIAHNLFRQLESSPYGKPDTVTYGTYLKVIANQMPYDQISNGQINGHSHSHLNGHHQEPNMREVLAEAIFKKCCNEGQVGNLVLTQMRLLLSPERYQMILGKDISDSIDVNNPGHIPPSWRRNVQERDDGHRNHRGSRPTYINSLT